MSSSFYFTPKCQTILLEDFIAQHSDHLANEKADGCGEYYVCYDGLPCCSLYTNSKGYICSIGRYGENYVGILLALLQHTEGFSGLPRFEDKSKTNKRDLEFLIKHDYQNATPEERSIMLNIPGIADCISEAETDKQQIKELKDAGFSQVQSMSYINSRKNATNDDYTSGLNAAMGFYAAAKKQGDTSMLLDPRFIKTFRESIQDNLTQQDDWGTFISGYVDCIKKLISQENQS